MKLGEVPSNATINIEVIRGDTSVNLSTSLIWVASDALYVEPFMHGSSFISFMSEGLRVEMTVVRENDVPLFWKLVTITKEEFDGRLVHCIRSNIDGVRLNRRNSFRVFVGNEGSVMEATGGGEYDVTIKDISANGISFVTRSLGAPTYKPGSLVHIKFEDREARFVIDVQSRVVRRTQRDNSYVYGCRFVRVYPQISKYVAQKQIRNRNKRYEALHK